MSTATWGEPEPHTDETYPSSLLKHLLQQMMRQFAADGGCVALFDASMRQMVVRLHMRLRSANVSTTYNGLGADSPNAPGLRSAGSPAHQTGPVHPKVSMTGSPGPASSSGVQGTQPLRLPSDPSLSVVERQRRPSQSLEEPEIIVSSNGDLFPVGESYPYGQDLIGYTWRNNEPDIMRHADYLSSVHAGHKTPFVTDITPTWYLSVPILEPMLVDDIREKKRVPAILGVVVLYQTTIGPGFQQRQRQEALHFAERIALYLQNDHLRRLQERTSDYMKRLQQISTAFPTTVKLSKLVEDIYSFVNAVVDVSSMLLTFYDRDTNKIYDVFAVRNGQRVEGLTMEPVIATPEARPVWWRVTQQEKRSLSFSPASFESGVIEDAAHVEAAEERRHPGDGVPQTSRYEELLQGTWGDQRKAESFLLLPMKMFTRVIGSLMLTSTRPHAFEREEVVVLETMVQIITVSIENAKLYDRSRQSLQEAKYREESLAAMYSALQVISSVLNLNELLHKFVETVANLVQAEMCTFFQLTPNGEELIAQAIYDTTGQWKDAAPPVKKDEHDDLIAMIHLPFKGSVLEPLASETFFYLDPPLVDELAQASGEGGAIFLRETHITKMLMIPVHYQTEMVGILAVHTPRQNRVFRPKEISVLLAICAQAASAIRNAQLFEQIQEAYAELQRMDKLKDEFIVTASHELRTPLSAISGYSSLLKRQSGRINQQQILRFASKISSSAQQLIDLVANMTEAAKMGAQDKKLDLQMGPVQVLAAAELAATMLSVNIEQKISLYVASDLWVTCDALHLRQVLTNLLDNAAKYSPPTGRILVLASATTLAQLPLPEDQVDLALLADGEGDTPVVRVRVCDEGGGIPPDDQQKIFEKFVRTSSSLTTPVRGSGLGLYICRRYIEAMGGKLWLERSLPGEGSVFSFYLPRIEAPIEASEQDESESETPTQ